MTKRELANKIARYILSEKIDVLNDDGFINREFIEERFDLDRDTARLVCGILGCEDEI